MKKQKKLHSFIEELVLALCTIIMLVPIYYLVLGAFKDRKDIIKYPLLLTKELFTLENFPYVINKMKYWQALANTVTITLASLVIVIICASLAGFAIARIRSKLFRGYYSVLVTLMVIPFIGCLLPLTVQATRLGTYDSIWGCILIQSAWNMPFATFLFAGFNIFASSFFTALGNGLISAAISFLRTLVFQTASVLILPLIFDVDGIWYAITVAEVFATLISVIFLFAKRKKYHYMECSPHGKK